MTKKMIKFFMVLLSIGFLTSSCSTKEKSEGNEAWLKKIPNYQNASGEYAKGPNGEDAVAASDIILSDEQYKNIASKNLKAVLLWAGAGEWYNALTEGARDEFNKMGVKVLAVSDAQFDPAKQATDIETAMALKPDIILTLPVDPVSGTKAYKVAVDKNVKIVFADNGVNGYVAGKEYVSIVTGDQYGMGRAAAKEIAKSIGGKGKIGVIYYDVDFLVTNNRDNEFIRTIIEEYPDIKIVSMKGFSEEDATGDVAATMLTQYPDLNAIFVSWDVAAEPVVAELRTRGNKNIKVVTFDLGGNNDLDMANGGNVYAKIADMPYQGGQTMAKAAALSILGANAPAYIVSDVVEIRKDNMKEGYIKSFNKTPNEDIMKIINKK